MVNSTRECTVSISYRYGAARSGAAKRNMTRSSDYEATEQKLFMISPSSG
jgi:hypothetical protein